ncbi:hypothetical protein FOZ61_006945 [Perkinsus olseni]|uniref:Uncharacterized protein n=1 Tax=Perkinsus olseni TaxID=32597 RepID=A0A7J6LB41_PEROL|nr:hypothetical protein FOZ61_006945 [Perkinsus olseni]KAF4659890.1 hypothetical protein FOL46_006421 [Perkinsus olseni]
MARFTCMLTIISALAFSSQSRAEFAGREYCCTVKGGLEGAEYILSFVNSSHMNFFMTDYFRSAPMKSRTPKILVRGIPYEYNATSGAINATISSIRTWPVTLVGSSDMSKLEYNELEDELRLRMRCKLFKKAAVQTFRRC